MDVNTNPLPSNALSKCLPPHRTAALHVQSRRKTSSPSSCVKSASTLAEELSIITKRSVSKFTHMFFFVYRLSWGTRIKSLGHQGQIIVCIPIWKSRPELEWVAPAAGKFLSKPCPTACMPKVAWVQRATVRAHIGGRPPLQRMPCRRRVRLASGSQLVFSTKTTAWIQRGIPLGTEVLLYSAQHRTTEA